ncbi:MAG: hypothetical protein H7289_08895 [Mucilaginibacter sp.]|nr:hypothetical protein [Mucilaginibacter sp.]
MKKKFILTLLFVIGSAVVVFAQGPGPCNDADPDGVTCPIDTWVVAFAIIALLFTMLHLNRKQKNTAVLV